MKLSIQLDREDLTKLQLPIIVEMWRRIESPGRVRRSFQDQFTVDERRLIRSYYNKAYKWHLQTGFPEGCHMLPKTYNLLQRAVAFFAGI